MVVVLVHQTSQILLNRYVSWNVALHVASDRDIKAERDSTVRGKSLTDSLICGLEK